jgi:multidrug efflux pump subunit AcrB
MSEPAANASAEPAAPKYGITGRLAALFIDSRLTPIVIVASILMGLFAVLMLPREEEPQIKVPMVDVIVAMPGSTAAEVENRMTRPMEKLLGRFRMSNTSTRPPTPATR